MVRYLDKIPHAPCAMCDTLTRTDCLIEIDQDVPELPLQRLVCPGCDDALTVEEHDDPACMCRACFADRARSARTSLAKEAQVNGGLRLVAVSLLGLTEPEKDVPA